MPAHTKHKKSRSLWARSITRLRLSSRQLTRKCAAWGTRYRDFRARIGSKIKAGDAAPKPLQVEAQDCLNCGQKLDGRYCSNCGQSIEKNRLERNDSLRSLFYAFTNVDTRFLRSMKDLLIRPGYMIRDFLNGKRSRYLHPFELLFLLSALYYILTQLMGIDLATDESNLLGLKQVGEKIAFGSKLKASIAFINSTWQKSIALKIIAMLPLYIISGRWSFLKKSREMGYSWAEWTILQSYLLSAVSFISIIGLLLFGKRDLNDLFDAPILWVLLIQIYAYKQLFGYGFWGTLRRVLTQYLRLFFLLIFSLGSLALLIKLIAQLFGFDIE